MCLSLEQILSLPITQTQQYPVHSSCYIPSISTIHTVGLALKLASCSLSFLLKLFQHEIQHDDTESYIEVRRRHASLPLCCAVLQNTVPDSLNTAVEVSIQCWIHHGHWLYDSSKGCSSTHLSSDSQQCINEAKQCLNHLNEIVCYISWIYCIEEDIPFGDCNCCLVIVDAISSSIVKHITTSCNDKMVHTTTTKEKYVRGIKVHFLLLLETTFSTPLQCQLGCTLELSQDLSIVVGF